MNRERSFVTRPSRAWLAACTFLLLAFGLQAPAPAQTTVRELYVPADEFQKLVAGKPNGLIMPLSEYRELVERAAASGVGRAGAMPPFEAALVDAEYRARVTGDVAIVEGTLTIEVLADGWVRCPLGRVPEGLGRVRLDGAPGWLLIEQNRAGHQVASALVRGKGRHALEIRFAVPIVSDDRGERIDTVLFRSPAARLELEVDGEATATPGVGVVETERRDGRTRFRLTFGGSDHLDLLWKRRRAMGEGTALLNAEHALVVLPRLQLSPYRWTFAVSVEREPVEVLRVAVPADFRVLEVDGGLVLRWEMVDGVLVITLKGANTGVATFDVRGLAPGAESLVISAPRVEGAYSDRGALAILDSSGLELTIADRTDVDERVASNAGLPAVPEALDPSLFRAYDYARPTARVQLTAVESDVVHRTNSTVLLRIRERLAYLEATVDVIGEAGRLHEFELALPAGWDVRELEELTGEGRVGRWESTADPDDPRVKVTLNRALEEGDVVSFRVGLLARDFGVEREWERRQLDLRMPTVLGAREARHDAVISLETSLHLGPTSFDGWRTLTAAERTALGLNEIEPRLAGEGWVAALRRTSLQPAESVTLGFEVVQRPSRGEYRSVTHIVATERMRRGGSEDPTRRVLEVQTDLVLAVVDRGVDTLRFVLPELPDDVPVAIVADDIQEISRDGRTRVVRFGSSWVGVRRFLIEYELPYQSGEELSIRVPSIEGRFGSERFVVIGSEGSVEIEAQTGDSLVSVGLDELPDFATTPDGTRVVSAHRLRGDDALGALAPRIHVRAPVIGRLAGRLEIATLLSDGGGSVTEVEFVLSYSRAQSLTLELPRDARVRAVSIDGEPVATIRPGSAAEVGRVSVPLPPRSFARVRILYERDGAPWDPSGTFTEVGPALVGVPVGETAWTIYHPTEYRLCSSGGNMEVPGRDRTLTVWETVVAPVLRGRAPRWSFDRRTRPAVVHAHGTPITPEERAGASFASHGTDRNRIAPGDDASPASNVRVPIDPLLVEGGVLELYKYAGAPTVELEYRTARSIRASESSAFMVTLVVAWLLVFALAAGLWWRLWWVALVVGVALPFALRQEPGLWLPFTEALVTFGALYAVWCILKWIVLWMRKPRRSRALRVSTAALVLGVVGLFGSAAEAAPRDDQRVIIPFDLQGWLRGEVRESDFKAYVPHEKFRELWRAAYPDRRPPLVASPVIHAIGPAEYSVEFLGEDRFELTGGFSVLSTTDTPMVIDLDLQQLGVVEVSIDGEPAAVEVRPGEAPRIQVIGAGVHRIDVRLSGRVRRDRGTAALPLEVIDTGSVSSVEVSLPVDAELEPSDHPITIVEAGTVESGAVVRVELGTHGSTELSWRKRQIEGDIDTQLEVASFVGVLARPDGFLFDRIERVTVTGGDLDRLRFRWTGDGELRSLTGDHVSEWSITESGGDRLLTIVFEKPVTTALLRMSGIAVGGARAELPALTPEGRTRQEVWVGLRHGEGVRFSAESLSGLDRASPAEVTRAFGIVASNYDRLFHQHGSATGAQLLRTEVENEVTAELDLLALREMERTLVFLRARVVRAERGSLAWRVPLPAGWTVRNVRSRDLRDWSVEAAEVGSELRVDFLGRVAAGAEVAIGLERMETSAAGRTALPTFDLLDSDGGTVTIDRTVWVLAAREAIELTSSAGERWRPLETDTVSSWVQLEPGVTRRFAYQARRADDAPVIETRVLPTATVATAVWFAQLGETRLTVNGRLEMQVRYSGRDRFTFRLPTGARLERFRCVNQRSVTQRETPDGLLLDLVLQSPHRGELLVDVGYTRPRSDAAGGATPTVVDPVALLDATGQPEPMTQYVGLVHTSRTFTLAATPNGVSAIDRERLPYLPSEVDPESIARTYRADGAEWSIALVEEVTQLAEELAAVVRLADLVTVIGTDGVVRTRATYSLVNRSLQFFMLELPAGAELWGVTVDGRSVAVASDGSSGSLRLRVPVERGTTSQLPLEVTCYYAEASMSLPAESSRRGFDSPKVLPDSASGAAVGVAETLWTVHVPDDYALHELGQRLQLVPHSMKQARKLRHLLEQQQQVLDAVRYSETKRAKRQATRELIRLDQALGDNLAQLDSLGKSLGQGAQSRLLQEEDLARQWDDNRLLIDRANRARSSFRSELEGQEQDDAESADDRAFRDRAAFLAGRAWRPGKQVAPDGRPAPGTSAGVPAGLLIDGAVDAGWRRLQVPGIRSSATQVEDLARPGRAGSGEGAGELRSAPIGLQFATPDQAYEAYTFHGLAGDVTLEVELQRDDRTRSGLAWGAMVLAIAIAVVGRRRRGGA